MQYKSNLTNGFKDIVRKHDRTDTHMHRHTYARPDMVMTIPPSPTSWAGIKNVVISNKHLKNANICMKE